MILTKLLAFAGLYAALAPLPLQGTPPARGGDNTSADTAEGAEILRRIVVGVLDDAFDRTERAESSGNKLERLDRLGVVTTLWAHRDTVQHSRVFHMPGAGLFFALDAALPVVSREPEKDETGRSRETRDDEWERTRREVRGGGGGEPDVFVLGTRRLKKTEIDPRAIDQVIELVLRTVARHAGRIEGLGSQESITVALRLSGRAPAMFSGHEGESEGEYHSETRVWTDDEDEIGPGSYSFVLAGGSSAREQNLVIRVALADLSGFTESGLDRLRQRAQINRY